MASNTSTDLLCPDWIFSNNSNVHACKDRGWFTDYTPFESLAGFIYGDSTMPVAGVGNVVLPVKRSPNASGPNAHGTLLLKNVLHCPSSICNILGYNEEFESDYSVMTGQSTNGSSKGSIRDYQGRNVAYFDPNHRMFNIKLSGPPVGPVTGPSTLSAGGLYMINVLWADTERHRWDTHQQSVAREPSNGQHSQSCASYTTEEKQWLKDNYSDEYHFLQQHGLSIYKEEDRDDGRAIVRQIMAQME
ncbi:hypothetical protein BDV95DRAFT_670466 [Massariosphaeria phaeospora]|uniref:Retrovirus-related Pol polyprotein from transposon TNT 1-94-like beta-barrel domain-containing protein n=1 Tax=Massariosphaeria phaeospora TaxID=100035 RepID=A0A7C8M4N8_9PLEO|nr:hypothetical protein BDV95DRAFT_670466 [Massariosphaeria phaeospora]